MSNLIILQEIIELLWQAQVFIERGQSQSAKEILADIRHKIQDLMGS